MRSQIRLVAEQVAKVNPDLLARDPEGKVYSVQIRGMKIYKVNFQNAAFRSLTAARTEYNKALRSAGAAPNRTCDQCT